MANTPPNSAGKNPVSRGNGQDNKFVPPSGGFDPMMMTGGMGSNFSTGSYVKNKQAVPKSPPAQASPTTKASMEQAAKQSMVSGATGTVNASSGNKSTRTDQGKTPTQTQEDLDKSKDVKEKKDEWDTTCSAVCVGRPDIVAKKNINFEGVGSYGGAWYVTRAVHNISKGGVYKCTIDGGRGKRGTATGGSGKGSDKSKTGSGNKKVSKPKIGISM